MGTKVLYILAITAIAIITLCLAQSKVSLVGPVVTSYDKYKTPLTGSKKVFLTPTTFSNRASVFAFVAYFTTVDPVVFQIWRPTGTTNEFQLMMMYRFVPSANQLNTRAVIPVQGSNTCFLVQPGDQIAFLNEADVSTIGFVWDNSQVPQGPKTFAYTNAPGLNEKAKFDNLALPYIFAVAAVVDEDMTFYDQNPGQCKTGLTVPPEPTTTTTTTQPITTPDLTGPPGPPGPQGVQGIQGPQGPKGNTGLKGDPGTAGIKGDQGLKGDPGNDGQTGPQGPQGLKGDGGPQGIAGSKGAQGPPGTQGERGPPGAAGANTGGNAQAATDNTNCQCGEGLLHPYLILGLIIWLLILTLIVIMLLVLLTRRHNEYVKSRDSVRTLQRDSPWIVDARDDTWKEYTLTSDRMSDRLH